MKKLVSGIKPTGRAHLGNYFGMMKQLLDLEDKYDSQVFIADYHALTSVQDKKALEEQIFDLMVLLLAIGLDPKKTTLYRQSDIQEVHELSWILSSLTTVPYLMRAHAYKDAEAKNKDINVATFNYPILMASDIFLANADVVPVGKDQQQHVEIARDLAGKFNNTFGETFKLPKELLNEKLEIVIGTDGQKMSKSYENVIPIFASDQELKKIVMSIPTDSKDIDEPKDPDNNNLFKLHALILEKDKVMDLREKYEKPGLSYKEAKESFLSDLIDFITPIRTKRDELYQNRKKVLEIYEEGGKKIKKQASEIMERVRKNVGL